jgi:hypothetical protein
MAARLAPDNGRRMHQSLHHVWPMLRGATSFCSAVCATTCSRR